MNYLFGLIIVGLVVESQSVESADNLEKCNATVDREWLSKILQLFSRPTYPGGEEEESYTLPSEQLKTNDVYKHIDDELISMTINYTNNVVHGLNFVIDDQSIKVDNLQLHFNAFCDRIEFVGDYAAAGRISAISVDGAGRFNMTMSGVNTENTVHFERYEKDGKTSWRVTVYGIKLKPNKVDFDYTDLAFSSELIPLGPANRIINENWKAIFESTAKGPLEENFGELFKDISNKA